MKKITKKLFVVITTLMALSCFGQNDNPKHINVYNNSQNIETSDYIISIEDVVSNIKYAKFKIKISNKTADYLLFKGEECVFTSGSITTNSTEKPLFIEPYSIKSRVIDFKGTDNFHVAQFDVEIKGLYKVVIGQNSFTAPDFQLPPNSKDFTAGTFVCTLLKTEQETQSTWAKFNCKYNGQKIGFINPAKCVVKLPDGKEFASTNLKSKAEMMLPGEVSKFTAEFQIQAKTADMQFTTMNIVWKDSFTETTAQQLAKQKVSFEVDAAKTAVKNK